MISLTFALTSLKQNIEAKPVYAEEIKIETPREMGERLAKEYDISFEEMDKTIVCESNWDPTAWNKTDPYGGAKGLGQFLEPTFNHYSKKAGIENPDIWNVEHQLRTMAYMFQIGEQSQWVCYRKIFKI